ncbi:MAG: hypothetical protein C0582_05575 [Alphaproteobacteria bacterium]|nr:MAG: hypothetical protein C0582_05575 [Alphaproteobacteria bacterium]
MGILTVYIFLMRGLHPLFRLLAPFFYNQEAVDQRLVYTLPQRPQGSCIWVHGASLGELKTLEPLLRYIKEKTSLNLVITSSSQRSFKGISSFAKLYGTHQFLPFDIPKLQKKFLDHWNPRSVIWTESDLWPGFLTEVKKRNIPAFLINGKLSERSTKRWKILSSVFKHMLSCFSMIYAQSARDEQAYKEMGINHVEYDGNIKFLQGLSPPSTQQKSLFKKRLQSDIIWLGSCTHPSEEEVLLKVHLNLLKVNPDTLLILAPRHPHRAEEIKDLCLKYHLTYQTYSEPHQVQSNVLIMDQYGSLNLFYSLVPLAFLGGSLIDKGGHNPIEAFSNHCQLLVGPYHYANQSLYDPFKNTPALKIVHTEDDIINHVKETIYQSPKSDGFFKESDKILDQEVKKSTALVERMVTLLDNKKHHE